MNPPARQLLSASKQFRIGLRANRLCTIRLYVCWSNKYSTYIPRVPQCITKHSTYIPRVPQCIRVGNGISFRKNSAEQTRNGFRYSAEESGHSEAFRGLPEESIPSSDWNGMTRKNWVYKKSCTSKYNWQRVFVLDMLRVGFFSTEWLETEFREFASIFVPRYRIPSFFLLCGMIRNGIPRVFCSAEQPEFRRNKPIVPSIPSSAE